jgi:hypothetical protein
VKTTGVDRGGRIGRGGVPLVVVQTPVGVPPNWEAFPQLNRVLAARLLTVLAERMVIAAGCGGQMRAAGPGPGGGDQDERAGGVAAGAVERQGSAEAS